MVYLVKKIIFTSRTCVEEWKLVVVYHLHGQTVISVGIPVTEKWPQKLEIWIKDGFEEMEHKFSCGTFSDRQHLVASKVFLLLKQPKKLCSIWGNSQSRWILLVSEANKIPLRKLGYSTPIFIMSLPFLMLLFLSNKTWTECHIKLCSLFVSG